MNKSDYNNRGLNKIRKASRVLILVFLTALYAAGCAGQENKPINEANKETNKEENSKQEKSTSKSEDKKRVINNGGLYVEYNGNVYYRQYTADCYAEEGIFGSYDPIDGAKKNMICKKQDQTAETVFEDNGEGDIYICCDKMYLEKTSGNMGTYVYSIDLNGKNEQEIGEGHIKGINEKSQVLVGMLADDKGIYQLCSIEGSTGEVKKITLTEPCVEFLDLRDGVIYYLGEVETEVSKMGKVKLCSVNVNGSDEKLLAATKPDLYEFPDRETQIPCFQFVKDTIYFSYGAYGGTGNFYQGGKIAKVEKDGSDFEIVSDIIGEEEIVNDMFYVVSDNEKEILYYAMNSEESENMALNLRKGETAKTDFIINKEGEPFEYKGGIGIYLDASSEITTWITKVNYNYLALDKEADYYTVNDIERCGQWVYYRMEANDEDPKASIGWRDGYCRIKTKVLRQKTGNEKAEELFEY